MRAFRPSALTAAFTQDWWEPEWLKEQHVPPGFRFQHHTLRLFDGGAGKGKGKLVGYSSKKALSVPLLFHLLPCSQTCSRHKYGPYSAELMIGMDDNKPYDNGTFHTFGTSPDRTSKPWGSLPARWAPSKARYLQGSWMNLAYSLNFTDRQVQDI